MLSPNFPLPFDPNAFYVTWKCCGESKHIIVHWMEAIFKLGLLKVIVREFFTDGDDDCAYFLSVGNNWFAPNKYIKVAVNIFGDCSL